MTDETTTQETAPEPAGSDSKRIVMRCCAEIASAIKKAKVKAYDKDPYIYCDAKEITDHPALDIINQE